MIRFLQRLQRGTVILIGLIVATYVASYVISVALGVVASGVDSTGEILVKSIVIAIPVMIVAGTVIAIPALIIVAIAEFRGWRSLVIHFSAGGVVGLLTGLAVTGTSEDALLGMLGGLGAGVIGSTVYWAIAGRN
ncbi:MAG: hypothetical protein AAGD23_11720, partial [Pseudomonadota bacterium]